MPIDLLKAQDCNLPIDLLNAQECNLPIGDWKLLVLELQAGGTGCRGVAGRLGLQAAIDGVVVDVLERRRVEPGVRRRCKEAAFFSSISTKRKKRKGILHNGRGG